MKSVKSRSLAVMCLLTAGGFGLALPAHSQVALAINGVQGTTETVCSQINILFGANDCSYGGTKAGTLNGWFGPSQGAAYYAVGSTGDSPLYIPVPGDARIAVPVSGTVILTGTGAGATVSGTFIIGAAARNVSLNPPARAVQRWSSLTHTLATTSVTTATVNAGGGFDYVVASLGAPEQICLAGGGACFGSQETAPDPLTGTANGWGVGGVGGTKPTVGIENIEFLAGTSATGTTDRRNFGATTTAVMADPSCNADPDPAVCTGVPNQSINLWAPTGREDPGYDNLILVFSTNGTGNITAGRAYWTQNFRFGLQPGQPPGDDSEQMGTFTFAGAAPVVCADFPANVLVDSTNNAIDAAAGCNNPGATITIVTGPSNGLASVSGTNQIIYTPVAGFEGTDTITYNGADDFSSDDGVLTISVTSNLLPAAPDGSIGLSTQGVAPQTVTGTLNVATLPGYSAGNAPAPIISVTQGAQGAVTFLNDTLTYAPVPSAFAGTDTFTYTLQDNNGDVDEGTVTVTTPNLVPDIGNGAITTEEEEASAPFPPVITAGNGSPTQHTLAVTTDGANGACTLTATNATGQVVYTPDPDFSGTDSCVLTLTDGNGDTDTATITVTVEQDPVVSFSGGSSAVDPWSLAFLAGLPLLRRRRLVLKLAGAALAGLAVFSVLPVVANAAAGADDDRIHQGLYLGAGINGTSLQSDLQSQDLADSLGVSEVQGQAEDFPLGGQLYQGWMFNSRWGIEGRYSATGDGKTDIVSQLGDGDQQKIGSGDFSLEGWTLYGVANWPVRPHWDVFAKLGYTDQTLDSQLSVDGAGSESNSDSDNGMAAALGARWRFARHWAVMAEGEYLAVDFNGSLDEPWRAGLNLEYWFGRYEPVMAAPVAALAVAAAPPPAAPAPAAPTDSDGDGVVDGTDQCPETPRGDRVGPGGCSCDVTRQLQFAFGSAELTEADRLILDEMAESLSRLKFVSGIIEGHTDSVGPEAYNQGLSERRAQSVADHLESRGIARDRMQVVGRGESAPVADNQTAEGRAQNRRVVAKRTDCET